MVDLQTVCCMCGDVGFPDKLFHCNKCRNRSQHSYCSNYYYGEVPEPIEQCNWCQSEERSSRSSRPHIIRSSSKSKSTVLGIDREDELAAAGGAATESTTKGKSPNKTPSPSPSPSPSLRPTTRRYKLLKDVMC